MKKIIKKVLTLALMLTLSVMCTGCLDESNLPKNCTYVQIGNSGYYMGVDKNYNSTSLKEDDFMRLMISYKYEHSLDIPNISFYKIEGVNNFDLKEYIYTISTNVQNYTIADVNINGIDMEKHTFNEEYGEKNYYEEEYLFKGLDDNFYIIVFTERDENLETNTNEKYINTITKK